MAKLKIWTDGSCINNPGGQGGWAWTRCDGEEAWGHSPSTTNNRMEMQAVLEALRAMHDGSKPTVYSDSEYVVKGLTIWRRGWRSKNWMRKGAEMPNRDLWLELESELLRVQPAIQWVRGHSGDPGNERADYLASRAANSGLLHPKPFKAQKSQRVPAPQASPEKPATALSASRVTPLVWQEVRMCSDGIERPILYLLSRDDLEVLQGLGEIGDADLLNT